MPLEMINTTQAPKAIGPYSQAVRAGAFLFVSGQISIAPETGDLKLFDGNTAEQARLVMKNLGSILKSQGLSFDSVVKTTIYLSNMDDFAAVNDVYASFFSTHLPARATVAVSGLPKKVSVEIDAIAFV